MSVGIRTVKAPAGDAEEDMTMPDSYGSAGASARARYRTLQTVGRTRRLLVLLAVAVIVGGLVAWLSIVWLGLIAAALSCLIIVVRRRRTHTPAAAWRKGAAGERATARRLRTLELAGYTVLHDLAIPHSNANIDHLVIGPTGVFVIDSKKWHRRTTVRAATGTLWIGRTPINAVVRPVLFEVRRAGEVLSQATGRHVEVLAVIAVHGPRLPRYRAITAHGVTLLRATRLVGWITRHPHRYDTAEVSTLTTAATTHLPPYARAPKLPGP
ncbi:nuclease-related domain-containing protein [Nonomuraea sp. CA-218870]|uniref:nuclease-related domain-containing protein n=1 Tax=Nonomuraea sp. CA-218870 TaxID=3239998 RepID=UPI003D8C65AA